MKIKSSPIGEITLSLTDIGISRPCHEFSTWQICVIKPIHENKILAKISEFTVITWWLIIKMSGLI